MQTIKELNKVLLIFVCTIIFCVNANHSFALEELRNTRGKFLLLLGPSGVGKSTLINELKKIDSRFEYVTPVTTRKLRKGEKDKIPVTHDELYALKRQGKLLTINKIYNIYYGTPKYLIDIAFAKNKFPVLDWPVDKLEIMIKNYPQNTFKVYLEPDNIYELERRLSLDKRDIEGKRLVLALKELMRFKNGEYDKVIDLKIINKKNSVTEIAKVIYQAYIEEMCDANNKK